MVTPGPTSQAVGILVVEDDAPTRLLLRTFLTSEGYDVADVADGATALDLVLRAPPRLILLDPWLPAMSGEAFVAAYRQLPGPHAPIVVLGGERNVPVSGMSSSVAAVVPTPFTLEELLDVVARFVPAPARPATTAVAVAPAPRRAVTRTRPRPPVDKASVDAAQRRRLLQRLAERVARVRAAIATISERTRELLRQEATRPLTSAEKVALRGMELEGQRLRSELELLRKEFVTLRDSRSFR